MQKKMIGYLWTSMYYFALAGEDLLISIQWYGRNERTENESLVSSERRNS